MQLLEDGGGYPFDFISPYPIETCEHILNDHSRRSYFDANPVAFVSGRKSLQFPFVDVHRLTSDIYEFRMEYQFSLSQNGTSNIEITGTFTRLPNGTHIKGSAKPNNRAKREWWAWVFLILFILFIVIISLVPPVNESPALLVFYWVQPFFWGWLCWSSYLQPIIQFIQTPQKWLGGDEFGIAQIINTQRNALFKAKFDMYAPMNMATCIEQLKKLSRTQHYQHTQAGMHLGTVVEKELFITFEENSPEQYYFLLERDMWSQPSPYHAPICLLGSLQAEEDMIRIQGYGYLPNQQIYFRIILFIILAGVIAVWVSPVAMIISPILYIAWQYKARNWLKQFQHYPERAIFRRVTMTNNRGRWFALGYDFDFYSPYPLADCLNMLLNYSIVGDYENAEGIHKSAYVSQGYLVTVTESHEGVYSFSVQNTNHRMLVEAVGKLEPTGYSTRVCGTSRMNTQWGWNIFPSAIGIFIILLLISNAGISISFALFLTILFLMALIGVVYVGIKVDVVSTGKYAEQTLGSKGGRKDKKDVADE